MSDVPELDRLIDEAENIRINRAWHKRERIFNLTLAGLLLIMLLTVPLLLTLGEIGAIVIAGLFSALTIPILAGAAFSLMYELLTPPSSRDMTKRYHYK
mgnify:CR=1 FL=1